MAGYLLREHVHPRPDRAGELAGDLLQQQLDLGVGIEEIAVEPPVLRESAVPDLHSPVGSEHRDRFEQTVESCRAGAQHLKAHSPIKALG